MFRQAVIALGSNLGNRVQYFANALTAFCASSIRVLSTSSIYETDPVGVIDQPCFLNAVCAVETDFAPEALLCRLLEIEAENGRVRTAPNGPRTLDLDLLFFENETRKTAQLILPHPRYLERDFVCVPLNELLAKPPLDKNPNWDSLRGILRQRTAFRGNSASHCRFYAKFS